MKKRFQMVFALAALGVLLGGAAETLAQPPVKPRVLGGYKVISKTSGEVRAAAEFALEAQGEKDNTSYRLEAVEKAESQTVAGTNYRLCLRVIVEDEEAGEEVKAIFQAVVFKNFKKEFTLKSWEESDCDEKAKAN